MKKQGTVTFYDRKKGIGFIVPDLPEPDVFVHHSGLAKGVTFLVKDDTVSYEIGDFDGRPVARDVAIVASNVKVPGHGLAPLAHVKSSKSKIVSDFEALFGGGQ